MLVTDCTLYAVLYCILFFFDIFAKAALVLLSSATGVPGNCKKFVKSLTNLFKFSWTFFKVVEKIV